MGQEIYLGRPSESVVNFISAQYDAKRTTVSLTCLDINGGDEKEYVFLSSFYDIENYEYSDIIKKMVGNDVFERYSTIFYDPVKIGNTVKRLNSFELTTIVSQGIEIPDSVSAISPYCFAYSNSILNGIPKSVVEIGEDAFVGCMEYSWGGGKVLFLGRTIEEVQDITDANGVKRYPWGISENNISAEYS